MIIARDSTKQFFSMLNTLQSMGTYKETRIVRNCHISFNETMSNDINPMYVENSFNRRTEKLHIIALTINRLNTNWFTIMAQIYIKLFKLV